MSLFDQQSAFLSLDETYPYEKPFIILAAWFEGEQQTQFGSRPRAKLHAIDAGGPLDAVPAEFSVWGAAAKQIEALEAHELPVKAYWKPGRPHRIEAAQPPLSQEQLAQLKVQAAV